MEINISDVRTKIRVSKGRPLFNKTYVVAALQSASNELQMLYPLGVTPPHGPYRRVGKKYLSSALIRFWNVTGKWPAESDLATALNAAIPDQPSHAGLVEAKEWLKQNYNFIRITFDRRAMDNTHQPNMPCVKTAPALSTKSGEVSNSLISDLMKTRSRHNSISLHDMAEIYKKRLLAAQSIIMKLNVPLNVASSQGGVA